MRAGRTDGNHAEVIKVLRDNGMDARSIAALGNGWPDVVVGWRGVNIFLEIKDGAKYPSQRALTAAEQEFFGTWGGQVKLVMSPEEAVRESIEHVRACGIKV